MTHPLEHYIDHTPDFPEPGVVFRDISPLLAQKFPETIDAMINLFSPVELEAIDAFAGIDARGFIFASAMAANTGKNLIMVRKGGKLPPPASRHEYTLEYGAAAMELKHGAGRIAIIDDVVATGGTLEAAAELCQKAGYSVYALAALLDLQYLNELAWNGLKPRSVIQYSE